VRVGHGFDAHRLVAGRPFVFAGTVIESATGPLGHSDGDALVHAVCDALLGALALGDLGTHFPSSDPRWEGKDSMVFLAHVAGLVHDAGYTVANVDASVVVQAPRLAAHVRGAAERIAAVLGVADDCVSVKPKTSDGMGYTGDGTGIAAYAVALVERAAAIVS
jgi:2-C-methyl-D-erythritol 2,4-cyclodiphosphate synthase